MFHIRLASPALFKRLLILACAGTLSLQFSSVQAEEKPLFAYVGTFSSPLKDYLPTQVDLPPGNGRGIHIFKVDRNTGSLTAVGDCHVGASPSALVINHKGNRLYSANETDHDRPTKEGSVTAYEIDRVTGQLKQLNSVRSGGKGPTYVSLHPNGRFLFVANYAGGSIAVLPVAEDGKLGEPSDVEVITGQIGPTVATSAPPGSFAFSGHDHPHAHMIIPAPSGRFVLHVDLGLDKIFVWKFDEKKGTLTPAETPSVSLPPGDGPRHLDFHPNGKWVYSIQEEGSTVALFDYEAATGKLTERQTLSTLPPGYAGSNFCSGIRVSQDGRHLYAANRLHDSIAFFSIGEDGKLTYLDEEWTRGDYPRSFSFDPTGRFLYSLNQRADNLAVFSVNQENGSLKFTGKYIPVGNPSSMVFLDTAAKQ